LEGENLPGDKASGKTGNRIITVAVHLIEAVKAQGLIRTEGLNRGSDSSDYSPVPKRYQIKS